jgi:hypothetical protein
VTSIGSVPRTLFDWGGWGNSPCATSHLRAF